MPSYKYTCGNCGEEFEFQQKMTDRPRKRCPKCHKHTLKKDYSAVAIHFKGTGFSRKIG